MAINNDVDVDLAILKLGKNNNVYNLDRSRPPQQILEWRGPDARPTDDEINKAWSNYKSQDQYKPKRKEEYPELGEQFDALYKDILAGKVDSTGEFAKAIKATKDKYPKP